MFDLETSIARWRKQMLAAGIKTPVPLEELEIHLREEIERQMKSGLNEQNAFEFTIRQIGQPKVLKGEFKKVERTSMKRTGILAALAGAVIILRILTEHPDAGHLRKNEQLEWLVAGMAMVLFGLGSAFFNFTLGDTRDIRLWKLVGIIYSVFAVWISLLPAGLLLTSPELYTALNPAARTLVFLSPVVVGLLSFAGWRFGHKFLPFIHRRRSRTAIGVACCLLGMILMSLFWRFGISQLGSLPVQLGVVLITGAWTAMAILGSVGYGLTEAARRQTKTADA